MEKMVDNAGMNEGRNDPVGTNEGKTSWSWHNKGSEALSIEIET